MNILYILGNGFDLNLGMKTRYQDFYENAYKIKEDDVDLIKNLKGEIQNHIENWAALEMKLGEYTSKLKSKKEFDIIFNDIREKLVDYIGSQEISEDDCIAIKSKIIKGMRFSFDYLTPGEKESFLQFLHIYKGDGTYISAISFNYTDSLERIFDFPQKKIKLPDDVGNIPTYFNPPIEHIHGNTKERFILGVDNIKQIKNDAFKNDEDIVNSFVKPKLNAESHELVDEHCRNLINDANIICIFGMSIGSTDATWWNYIGQKLATNNKRLIIYSNGNEIPILFNDRIQRKKREIMDKFLSFSTLDELSKNRIKQYISIVYNSPDMFNVDGLIHNKDTKYPQYNSSKDTNESKGAVTNQSKEITKHKAPKSKLKVTFPDGRVIEKHYAFETLKEVVQVVGIDRISELNITVCGIPLVSNNIDIKYASSQKILSNGWYLMTVTSTKSKKQQLDKISDIYNLGLKVEIVKTIM
jgi:hypothetical protein